MSGVTNPPAGNGEVSGTTHEQPIDLVGGPFSVIESDPGNFFCQWARVRTRHAITYHSVLTRICKPFLTFRPTGITGVFTALARKLGIKNIELLELYDIEAWAVDHLNPFGLILCFLWRKDHHRATDFEDPAAERVWFANQLSDDACASHALLNIVLNCPNIKIGPELQAFKEDTKDMSSVVGGLPFSLLYFSQLSCGQMKGLALSSLPFIREAHNSLARYINLSFRCGDT
jgi:hypothetical protein